MISRLFLEGLEIFKMFLERNGALLLKDYQRRRKHGKRW